MTRSSHPQGLRETDLYDPIRDMLVAQGYTVRAEVRGCDITASKNDELIVIELKRSFSVDLLAQAADRQRMTDSVYVALPRPREALNSKRWKNIQHLLRRLELGLILVSFTTRKPQVQIVFHPTPFQRKKHGAKRKALIKEISGRSADHNKGGSTRRKLITAYRENAVQIACYLEKTGPTSPKHLRQLGTGPKTLQILYSNVYDWFERVDHGTYGLKSKGQHALTEYPELAEYYRQAFDNALAAAAAQDQL